MQIERSGSVAFLNTAPPSEASAPPERDALDMRRFALQPQQAPHMPPSRLAGLGTRGALTGGALLTGSLVTGVASTLCPALSWWALAGLAGGSAGAAAAVQTGLARRARYVPQPSGCAWPLNIQRKAMLEAVRALHAGRPANSARAERYEALRRLVHGEAQAARVAQAYQAFLHALGPLGGVADTHEALKYMRWHVLLDWQKGLHTHPKAPHEAALPDQQIETKKAARAQVLWSELERLAQNDAMHLLHEPEGLRAWCEARLAFVLHRGLLPHLLVGCPVAAAHPEWFRHAPGLCLKPQHVADFIDYWLDTPTLDPRFIEVALNPAWL